jgi:Arc/MetJ family transcription regulator
MRTTVDLPDELHQQAMSIARDTSRSFSETVADLIRRGLGQGPADTEVSKSALTGLPVIRLGTVITTEDVRRLEDEDQ